MANAYPAAMYTAEEVEMLAKTVWGEARGCTPAEQRLVVWTALQRVTAKGYGNTIKAVLTAPRQFTGYRKSNPVDGDIYALVEEEIKKWARRIQPPTMPPYAPALPYLYFSGRRGSDGKLHNYFRKDW
jgi:spore germination cell wall hydrolase CwlJ-like protein